MLGKKVTRVFTTKALFWQTSSFALLTIGVLEHRAVGRIPGWQDSKSALLRHVAAKVTIFGLCYFLRKAPWSVDELTAVRQAHFYTQAVPLVAAAHAEQRAQRPRRRGRPKETVVTGYLIIDDLTHAKRYARAQAGLGRHYSGTKKKVVNGHSLYQSVYVLEGWQLPPGRSYIPIRPGRETPECQRYRRQRRARLPSSATLIMLDSNEPSLSDAWT